LVLNGNSTEPTFKKEKIMSDRDEFGAFLVGFIVGGLTGAVAALLFAPQSGEETRTLLKERGIELKDKAAQTAEEAVARAEAAAAEARARADELAKELKDRGQVVVDRGKEVIETTKERSKSVVEAAKKPAGKKKAADDAAA
jgi:gas vesicle protein